MPAESAGARTWLLGAVALWALATWVLGLAGLGGRIEQLPPDPALAQALPAALPSGEGRLGPLAQYAASSERPLFTTDRRPTPFVINPGEEDTPTGFDYVLTSVLISPGLEVAIVQPAGGGDPVRLKVGEAPEGAPGWPLASLEPRRAVFDGPEGQRVLELRVFDGQGGEAPTAMSTPARGPEPPDNGQRPATPAPVQPTARTITGRGPGDAAPPPAPAVSTPEQPAPAPTPMAPAADASGTPSPEAQVEAIRKRIEERRARLREQARQGQPPDP